jgi:transcriptional regulator GlxA family with amidase domain
MPTSLANDPLVVEHLLGPAPDTLFVVETMLQVLGDVIVRAYRAHSAQPVVHRDRKDAGRAIVDVTRTLLAKTFHEQVSLEELARTVATSPFHLCRIFHYILSSVGNSFIQADVGRVYIVAGTR